MSILILSLYINTAASITDACVTCVSAYLQHLTCLVSDRSCSLIRWIHSSSSCARYDARYSSRSLLKKVGDSPALAVLPSGNRGNRGLIHNLVWETQIQPVTQSPALKYFLTAINTGEQKQQTHPCVFWYQSALIRLEVMMMTLKPSSYHSNIIFLHKEAGQLSVDAPKHQSS